MVFNIIKMVPSSVWVFFACCFAHYIAPHAYVYFCVPDTLWGFIISPIKATSIECKAIRFVINVSADGIDYFWLLVAFSVMSWVRSFMMSLRPK